MTNPNNREAQSPHPMQTTNQPIVIYDTTLRDGAQTEGLSMSLEDKIRIAHKLDSLGVAFIEGGWPGANPKDGEFFQRLQAEPLVNAEVVAFCSTRRPGTKANEDPMLVPIVAAGTKWITLFGKSWDLHVTEGLRTSLDENLAMITDTIAYLRGRDRHVIYDAEHWFDGYKANPDYALQTLGAAIDAGAAWLVLCDTNGGTLPDEVAEITDAVIAHFGDRLTLSNLGNQPGRENQSNQVRLGIHTHNDAGVAVANALAAIKHGAMMVQGTINGYGERCGNANLCTVIPNLQLKMGYPCLAETQLQQLTDVSRQVSELVNLAPYEHAPFVGLSAFAHKGGIHVSAVKRNPKTYEHIEPETIGNRRRIVISEQSGLSNVLSKAETFGIKLDKNDATCRHILQQMKELEQNGYQFEAAEASFELLMRQAMGDRPKFFALSGFRVDSDSDPDGNVHVVAIIKVLVKGEEKLIASEGNGPISALDAALRKALVEFYPAIAQFHLTDYKVRILNSNDGTNAKTRVLIESSNGEERWTTLGVSSNIIAASYQALVEGLEYGLILAQAKEPIAAGLSQ
ncbi:2-isopropylmalate synthase/homocitrate synthase family protein [Thalassoporum mexicanum PCC 7367]|nr:citramalate synthase [Pseudanabaena sp. PCC 7367]AFY71366.1 2-isopropylmalate synthase/homocitrate synthase family protein [Pseudanabaena sp. PCC 7367]